MCTSVTCQPLHRLQDLLQHISPQQSQPNATLAGEDSVDPELTIWLYFVARLSETLQAESHMASRQVAESAGNSSGEGLQPFRDVVNKLGSRDWRNVQGVLRIFLYLGGWMDSYQVRKLVDGEGHIEP